MRPRLSQSSTALTTQQLRDILIPFNEPIEKALQRLGWNGSLRGTLDMITPDHYQIDRETGDSMLLTLQISLKDLHFMVRLRSLPTLNSPAWRLDAVCLI